MLVLSWEWRTGGRIKTALWDDVHKGGGGGVTEITVRNSSSLPLVE